MQREEIKNTSENKAKFFAQYYGQKILRWYQWNKDTENSIIDMKTPMQSNGVDNGWFLELRPLESITLDEIKQHFHPKAFKIIDPFKYGHKGPFSSIEYRIKWDDENFITGKIKRKYSSMWIYDEKFKLRELGFLVSFGDLSPKKLIEYGWVKLKE
jgi:hypothetical protein